MGGDDTAQFRNCRFEGRNWPTMAEQGVHLFDFLGGAPLDPCLLVKLSFTNIWVISAVSSCALLQFRNL